MMARISAPITSPGRGRFLISHQQTPKFGCVFHRVPALRANLSFGLIWEGCERDGLGEVYRSGDMVFCVSAADW